MIARGSGGRDVPPFDPSIVSTLGIPARRLAVDSRAVEPGDMFLAYPGESRDGRAYIPQAVAAGAGAVLWDADGFSWDESWRVPNLGIPGLKAVSGVIADHVYGEPSKSLWMVGITGTNGKTSCAHWLAHSFTELGRKTAVVGTLGNGFWGELTPAANTTPDAVTLHGMLRQYLDQGAQGVAMEVSSHGLAQGRVNGVRFDVAMLTNLSRDHLDYHGDMASYGRTKATLFRWQGLRYAVLNMDDSFGADLARQLQATGVETVGYGFQAGAIRGGSLSVGPSGLSMTVQTPWGGALVSNPSLLGAFNASNLLGVLAVLLVSDVPLERAARLVSGVRPVAGRMECVGGGNQPLVVVDYAHTPDALEKVLRSLREIVGGGRLICTFGCGGDRDKGKRPLMGEIASRLADLAIVTSDNPRGEDPRAIIEDILAGAGANYYVEEDRAAAIDYAVSQAKPGDVVLVAGKGHEAYQEISGKRLPFSDVEVSRRVLERMKQGEGNADA